MLTFPPALLTSRRRGYSMPLLVLVPVIENAMGISPHQWALDPPNYLHPHPNFCEKRLDPAADGDILAA